MNPRTWKTGLVALVLVSTALALAACGGSGDSAAPPESAAADPAPPEPTEPNDAIQDDVMESMDGDNADTISGGHEHDMTVDGVEGMSVSLAVENDVKSGINIRIDTESFAFTPENVTGDNVAGQGHAHFYVNGEKIGRVYEEWAHLDGLPPGDHELRVTLNANSHAEYALDGATIEDTVTFTIPEAGDDAHAHAEMVEGVKGMAVTLEVEPDARAGFNVRIVPTNFAWAPENVNGDNVAGEGHAHLYLDGEQIGRYYGEWAHIDALPEGEFELRATLNSNQHATYALGGTPVEAAVKLTVTEDGGAVEDLKPGPGRSSGEEGGDRPDAGATVIVLVGGEPTDGPVRVKLKKGGKAKFIVTSDITGEIHVHGFDVTKNVGPGSDANFNFGTDFEGIFEIELHGPNGDVTIGSVVVEPR